MRYAIFAALLLGACATAPAAAQTQCLPAAGFSRAELDALKAAEWQLPDEARRNALAFQEVAADFFASMILIRPCGTALHSRRTRIGCAGAS